MSSAARHWRVWTAFALVFASGVAIGALSSGRLLRGKATADGAASPSSTDSAGNGKSVSHGGGGICGRGHMKERLLAHFAEKLNLNPEQKKKIAPILEAMTKKIDAIHKEKYPEIHKVISDSMTEIETVLSPEQKKTLEKMKKRVGHGGGGCQNAERQGCPEEPKVHKGKGKGKGRERRSEVW